jgi:dihydroorotase
MDLIVEGKIFFNGVFQDCCIGIENEKIVKISKIINGGRRVKLSKGIILPSGVDIHVHFRDPGLTYKEDFFSGSLSAIFGGISCIFDMPNTIPRTTCIEAVEEKLCIASSKSVVDYGLFIGLTNNNYNEIEKLSKFCNGFKIFLGESTNSLNFNIEKLREVLKNIQISGKIVLIHAEDQKCLNDHKCREFNCRDHLLSRPTICEAESISKILSDSKELETKIHICHLSSNKGLKLLRNRSSNISVGVTAHHLLFDIDNIEKDNAFLKINPPIRKILDRKLLWSAACNGFLDVLESDHAPHSISDKKKDFEEAPSGIPGVETIYPLFIYLCKIGNMSFNRLISLMCERPANLLGVPKGKIDVGMDADFIFVDLKNICRVQSEQLHSKCRWSAYDGMKAIFPSDVFIRGHRVVENYELCISKGFGKSVKSIL